MRGIAATNRLPWIGPDGIRGTNRREQLDVAVSMETATFFSAAVGCCGAEGCAKMLIKFTDFRWLSYVMNFAA